MDYLTNCFPQLILEKVGGGGGSESCFLHYHGFQRCTYYSGYRCQLFNIHSSTCTYSFAQAWPTEVSLRVESWNSKLQLKSPLKNPGLSLPLLRLLNWSRLHSRLANYSWKEEEILPLSFPSTIANIPECQGNSRGIYDWDCVNKDIQTACRDLVLRTSCNSWQTEVIQEQTIVQTNWGLRRHLNVTQISVWKENHGKITVTTVIRKRYFEISVISKIANMTFLKSPLQMLCCSHYEWAVIRRAGYLFKNLYTTI